MKRSERKQQVQEHNEKYVVMQERRKVAVRYVDLLKAPKHDQQR